MMYTMWVVFFFFQAEDGIRDLIVTGVQTCALPIWIGPKNTIVINLSARRVAGIRSQVDQGLELPASWRVGVTHYVVVDEVGRVDVLQVDEPRHGSAGAERTDETAVEPVVVNLPILD